MTVNEFKKDFFENFNKISPEQLIAELEANGVEFEKYEEELPFNIDINLLPIIVKDVYSSANESYDYVLAA